MTLCNRQGTVDCSNEHDCTVSNPCLSSNDGCFGTLNYTANGLCSTDHQKCTIFPTSTGSRDANCVDLMYDGQPWHERNDATNTCEVMTQHDYCTSDYFNTYAGETVTSSVACCGCGGGDTHDEPQVPSDCLAGFYYEYREKKCKYCHLGTYQNEPGQDHCLECHKNHYQDAMGAAQWYVLW